MEGLGHQDETEDYSRTFGFGHEHDDQDHTARRRVDSGESDASQPPQTQSHSGLSIGLGSRPPSRAGPITPGRNPLDSSRRQRTTPLIINAAPSAWSGRRPVPARRKSDAGSRSDSEVGTCLCFYHHFLDPMTRPFFKQCCYSFWGNAKTNSILMVTFHLVWHEPWSSWSSTRTRSFATSLSILGDVRSRISQCPW